jgi:hypothetical protein
VAISGPVRVAVGESATFYAVSSTDPQPLRVTWVTPPARDVYGVTVPFASEGCFEITLEAIFPDGKRTAVLNVAVGEATCGG